MPISSTIASEAPPQTDEACVVLLPTVETDPGRCSAPRREAASMVVSVLCLAEEVGVEPTGRDSSVPTALKAARPTGDDALPKRILSDQLWGVVMCDAFPTTRRVSPMRCVKPLPSKYSSTSMTTLRPMPAASRNWRTVKGACAAS